MARRVSNHALISVVGEHVTEKWTSAKIGFIYRATIKRTYGLPIIAQYTSVISHKYYGVCDRYLTAAAVAVGESIEDILHMECEAEESDGQSRSPRYIMTALSNNVPALQIHLDIMKLPGLVYNIDVLAAEGHETEAQELTGIAMSTLDRATKKLIVKPLR